MWAKSVFRAALSSPCAALPSLLTLYIDKVYHLHGTQSSNGNLGVTLVAKTLT